MKAKKAEAKKVEARKAEPKKEEATRAKAKNLNKWGHVLEGQGDLIDRLVFERKVHDPEELSKKLGLGVPRVKAHLRHLRVVGLLPAEKKAAPKKPEKKEG